MTSEELRVQASIQARIASGHWAGPNEDELDDASFWARNFHGPLGFIHAVEFHAAITALDELADNLRTLPVSRESLTDIWPYWRIDRAITELMAREMCDGGPRGKE